MPVMKLPRMGGKVSELRDHFLRMTDRSPICPSSSTRVGVEKRSPRSRDARRVSWDIYDYVLAISRTPSLESCASPEPEELVMSAVLLYQEGDVLRLEAESNLRLRVSNPGPPLHPRVQALRESPLEPRYPWASDALGGEVRPSQLRPSAASSGCLDPRGRRTDSATLTSKFGRMEEVFGEYGALFTRGESLLVNGIKAELTPRDRTRAPPPPPPRRPGGGERHRMTPLPTPRRGGGSLDAEG